MEIRLRKHHLIHHATKNREFLLVEVESPSTYYHGQRTVVTLHIGLHEHLDVCTQFHDNHGI